MRSDRSRFLTPTAAARQPPGCSENGFQRCYAIGDFPPQLIIAWLPTRDVAAALRQRVQGLVRFSGADLPSDRGPPWAAARGAFVEGTVRQYRSYVARGYQGEELCQGQMSLVAWIRMGNNPAIQSSINDGVNPASI